MKKLLPMLLAALMVLSSCSPPPKQYSPATPQLPEADWPAASGGLEEFIVTDVGEYRLAAETAVLALYICQENAELAVVDKASGKTWFSNPYEANPGLEYSDILRSQISLKYVNTSFAISEASSGELCVDLGQFEIIPVENGVRVIYTIGKQKRVGADLPPMIRKSVLDGIMEGISRDQLKAISKIYSYNAVAEAYMKASHLIPSEVDKCFEAFDEAGFDADMITQEFIATNNNLPKTSPVFVLPFEYELLGDSLLARFLAADAVYNENLTIIGISFLTNFCTALYGTDGFAVIPDGSGGLIRFDGRDRSYYTNNSLYSSQVYGMDVDSWYEDGVDEKVRLPMFAVADTNGAVICEAVSGAALMTLNVEGPKYTPMFRAYFEYAPHKREWVSYFGSDIMIFNKTIFQEAPVLRYTFLAEQDPSYASIANAYRADLEQRGILPDNESKQGFPLQLSIVGEVEATSRFLLFPYKDTTVMASFAEAAEILETIGALGVDSMEVSYLGAINGGIHNDYLGRLRFNSDLGGEKGFKELVEAAAKLGAEVYPEVLALAVPNMKNGFTMQAAARTLQAKIFMVWSWSLPFTRLITNTGEAYYLLSPHKIEPVLAGLGKKLTEKGVSGLALADISGIVYSSGTEKNLYNRQEMTDEVTAGMSALASSVPSLMINNPTFYTLPYASVVTDLSLECGYDNLIDESIPFMQMLLRGHADYSGRSINTSQNGPRTLLKSIETGAALKYTVTYRDAFMLKQTKNSFFYATSLELCAKEISEIIPRVSSYYSAISGQRIVGHSIRNGVAVTEYENGVVAVVNYSNLPVEYGGTTIPAEDFLILGLEG